MRCIFISDKSSVAYEESDVEKPMIEIEGVIY